MLTPTAGESGDRQASLRELSAVGQIAFTLGLSASSTFIPDKHRIISFGHKAQVMKIFPDTESATQHGHHSSSFMPFRVMNKSPPGLTQVLANSAEKADLTGKAPPEGP